MIYRIYRYDTWWHNNQTWEQLLTNVYGDCHTWGTFSFSTRVPRTPSVSLSKERGNRTWRTGVDVISSTRLSLTTGKNSRARLRSLTRSAVAWCRAGKVQNQFYLINAKYQSPFFLGERSSRGGTKIEMFTAEHLAAGNVHQFYCAQGRHTKIWSWFSDRPFQFVVI